MGEEIAVKKKMYLLEEYNKQKEHEKDEKYKERKIIINKDRNDKVHKCCKGENPVYERIKESKHQIK